MESSLLDTPNIRPHTRKIKKLPCLDQMTLIVTSDLVFHYHDISIKKKKQTYHLLEPFINHSETVLVSVSQWKKRNLGDGKRITFSFSSVGSGDFPEFGSYHQLLNVCAESQGVASSHFAQSSSYKPQTPTNEVQVSYDDFSGTTSIT